MASSNTRAFDEHFIYYALIGSCLVHLVFLAVTYFILPKNLRAKVRPMEIRYHAKPIEKVEKHQARIESVSDLQESRKASSTAKSFMDRQLAKPEFLKDAAKLAQHIDIPDKQPIKMSNLLEKRSISVPVIATQKITNPKYVGYNDRIRDKIRNRAYFYIDDPKFQAGEVYMTFVVTADGNLKDLQIIDERSHANEYLRSVGLRSVKESSPFPAFPPELKYPELSFNVVISFEVSNGQ